MSAATVVPPTPPAGARFGKSNLTQQLEHDDGQRSPRPREIHNGSPKPRSLSDASKPTLSPSPAFHEPRRSAKDDTAVSPTTPRRQIAHSRGLSLQMPLKDTHDNTSTAAGHLINPLRMPLSPKLEPSNIYGSPASMLPRHSRGLDYTRACTNLHHSTLADSTPEGSPITGRAIQIPGRRSLGNNNSMESPSSTPGLTWASMPAERTGLSSSVSSVNMLGSDSDSDDSSDMAIDRDMDDPMLNTPAASRPLMNIFNTITNSPGSEWLNNTPASLQTGLSNFTNMTSYRRSRWQKRRSQQSSSSVSMRSSRPSPGPTSPIMKSVENTDGYFAGLAKQQLQSRRESLSLGTDHLHLSDSEESEAKAQGNGDNLTGDGRPVIKRAVTRRSNLLPKTKGFARIKAALLEESAPIDSEARREAQVIKQVHESDTDFARPPATSSTGQQVESLEVDTDIIAALPQDSSMSSESFGQHVEKNSAGLGFWNEFDQRYRTPPPALLPRESSSAISDEAMETPGSVFASNNDNPAWRHLNRSRSRSITPLASTGPTAEEVARKVNKKRRRDDDFDPASFKRRAVSPGMSVQSSPVLPQSPVLTGDKGWGRPPPKAHNDRSNSGGSIGGGNKRVGLHGMNETNEGLMSMSID